MDAVVVELYGVLMKTNIDVGDLSLSCTDSGSGEPVVLVHGSLSDLRTWDAQVPALSTQRRVIAYSRRFHWPNPDLPAGATYAMQQHVDDLAKVVAFAGGSAHLAGNSWGAYVALMLAVQRPNLVKSLILEEPPLLPLFVGAPPSPPRLLPLFVTRPRTALAFVKAIASGLAPAEKALKKGDRDGAMQIFAKMAVGPRYFEKMTAARMEQSRQNMACLEGDITGTSFLPVTAAQLRTLHAPTLMMVGADSPPLLTRIAERAVDLLPNAKLVVIDRASHLMHEDNADDVNRAMLAFLAVQRDGAKLRRAA
jgi:pimeloyl-ACP methyl ester carboxylesterase